MWFFKGHLPPIKWLALVTGVVRNCTIQDPKNMIALGALMTSPSYFSSYLSHSGYSQKRFPLFSLVYSKLLKKWEGRIMT